MKSCAISPATAAPRVGRGIRRLVLLVSLLAAGVGTVLAQEEPASISGTTTGEHATLLLPGVQVTLIDAVSQRDVAEATSDEDGAFTFGGVPPGLYRVRGHLDNFQEVMTSPIRLVAGQTARTALDLLVAPAFEQHITVTPQATDLASTMALPAASVRVEDIRTFEPVSRSDIQNVLGLMPGAIHGPNGGPVTINGGRPTQTRVQLDGMAIIDPVTGRADIDLPTDAIDAVQILPNPTGPEYGRLSAGVIQFRTRQAPARMSLSVSNFVPEPLFRQDGLHGIRDFTPRIFVGGPLYKDRLFFAESLLYEHYIPRVYGLEETPETETTRTRFNSFTRLDAALTSHHFATLTLNVGPRRQDQIAVGRFLDPSASPSQRIQPFLISAAERTTIGQTMTLESAVSARNFTTDVDAAGSATMVLSPDGRSGNFFNTQHRTFQTVQWKETVTGTLKNRTGDHLFKLGSDVLLGSYTGTDVSRPIELRRLDGTLAERIEFAHAASERASATDAALFVGDLWTVTPRLKLEPALRLEHDGSSESTHLAPRLGATIGLTSSGTAVLHAGVGRFYERTPLLARSFSAFEPEIVTRYGANGVDLAGAPVQWDPAVAPNLQPSSSFIWNAGYDQRFNAHWQISANVLERNGSHDMIVQPVQDLTRGTILLDSNGASRYRELSFWGEFQQGPVRASASYVWSSTRGDVNAVDAFYGAFRNAIIQPNAYGPTNLDVPHRFVAWSSVPGPFGFTFSDVIEYRTGFPYSAVDALQQYVGTPNSRRFPNVGTIDFNVFHDVKLGSHVVRLIVRTYNLLNRFNPLEVQSNATAPDFGTFYSHVERRIALDFDLLK